MAVPVSIKRLRAICDVVGDPPWDEIEGLTPELVRSCILGGPLIEEHVDAGPASALEHAARIAWLMLNPPADPIEIDVGGGDFRPRWLVTDGNHRLYAAILREDETIEAEISGSWDLSFALLGVYPDEEDQPNEGYLRNAEGRVFEILTDGRTVWINADDGMSIGRFSRSGVDVHQDAAGQIETGLQCLACVHDLPPDEGWLAFVTQIERYYGLRIPEGYRPDYVVTAPEDFSMSP